MMFSRILILTEQSHNFYLQKLCVTIIDRFHEIRLKIVKFSTSVSGGGKMKTKSFFDERFGFRQDKDICHE